MNDSVRVPHPIAYQGSKRNLSTAILRYFPPRVERLVEPFAGSAAISLAAAARGLADCFWLNDAHRPLADLWTEIIERPVELSRRYASHWQAQLGQEREYFDRVRARFNRSRRSEYFLYLLARSVKSVIRYNARGEFNNAPDNRRLGARPDAMRRRIEAAAELLRDKTTVTALDYARVVRDCERSDVIYMDPPYQGVGGRRDPRYLPKVDREELIEQLAAMNRRKLRYLLSYDGRTGRKRFGEPLPRALRLTRIELPAGRSSQATLLGRKSRTVESLYLSPALLAGRPGLAQTALALRQFSALT